MYDIQTSYYESCAFSYQIFNYICFGWSSYARTRLELPSDLRNSGMAVVWRLPQVFYE